MNENQIWKGTGPIMYRVIFYDSPDMTKLSCFDPYGPIEECWKYGVLICGAGQYEDAYLGDDMESIYFFAETKAGITRALATYISSQIPLNKESKDFRKQMGAPPQLLNLENVEISDSTTNHELSDLNVPAFFANAELLYNSPLPPGERPFIATVRDDEESPGNYDICVWAADPVYYEEVENQNYNPVYQVPARDVNKTIMDSLSDMEIEENNEKIKPTIANTKVINFTNNPEFNLNRVFATTAPLKFTRAHQTLRLTRKPSFTAIRQPNIEISTQPITQNVIPVAATSIEKVSRHAENYTQRKKLKA